MQQCSTKKKRKMENRNSKPSKRKKGFKGVATYNYRSLPTADYAILKAVEEGDPEKVLKALSEGADITLVLPKYDGLRQVNLACVAAINGHLEVIRTLHHHDAKLNLFTDEGFNPLHLAVINDHPDVLCMLVDFGLDVDSQTDNKHGSTALHIASRLGNLNCTERLMALGADVNYRDSKKLTPIMRAAENNKVESINTLLSKGADTIATTDTGWDVGHIVAKNGCVDVWDLLSKRGHNLKKANQSGFTPMNLAIKYGHQNKFLIHTVTSGDSEMLASFLKAGADASTVLPEYCEEQTISLLCVAARNGKADLIVPLINTGASLNHFSKNGLNALHYAAQGGHSQVVHTLLNQGMNINSVTENEYGWTALHIAVEQGKTSMVELLADLKANLDAQDNNQRTPFMLAGQKNQVECMKKLKSKGAKTTVIGLGGFGAVHYAAKEGHYAALTFLIREGEDADLKDDNGYTPLHWAELCGRRDVANWLRKLDRPQGIVHMDLQIAQKILNESKTTYEHGGRFILNSICYGDEINCSKLTDGHYQDENGWTYLHHAAHNNNITTINLLLDNYLVASKVIAYDGSTPADVAKRAGHIHLHNMLMKSMPIDYSKIVKMAEEFLERHNMIMKDKYGHQDPDQHCCLQSSIQELTRNLRTSFNEKNKLEDKDLYSLLLYKISSEDNIEDIIKLLNIGCPVSPVGNEDVHALKLAIELDRPKIATALIAHGSDIFFRCNGLDLLKFTWKATDITIFMKMLITRMYDHRMNLEKKKLKHKSSQINKIAKDISECLQKDPKSIALDLETNDNHSNSESVKFTCKDQTSLLCEAADSNCPVVASFLYEAGARTSTRSVSGKTAAHHALDLNTQTSMEEMLLTHLGGSLYVPDKLKQTPFDIMQNTKKIKLDKILGNLAILEFKKLDNSLISAKDEESRNKIKQMTLLFGCLYVTLENSDDGQLWKVLYSYTAKLLLGSSEINDKVDNVQNTSSHNMDNDRLTWVDKLCQKITGKIKNTEFCDQGECNKVTFIDLCHYLNELKKKITKLSETEYKIDLKGETVTRIENIDCVLKKALKYTCKAKSNIFLHMLILNAGFDLNKPLDNMLKTCAIHYAAANGNLSTVAYLIHSCDIKIDALDRNRNNAAHYAYMYGHIETGNYLCKSEIKLTKIKNSSEKTPHDLRDAYKERLEELNYQPVSEGDIMELNKKLKDVYDQSNESELAKIHLDLLILRKNIKRSTLKDLALDKLVDYRDGENKSLYNRVESFINKVGEDIGKEREYLQGKLRPAGSSADGYRLGAPDELDYNWVLDWKDVETNLVEILEDQQPLKGYKHNITVESQNQKTKELLLGSKLLDEFHDAFEKAIPKFIDFDDKRLSVVLPGVKRTAVGVCLTLAWMGEDHKLLIVEVDIVPVIKTARPKEYPHPKLTEHISTCTHSIEIAGTTWTFSSEELDATYINKLNDLWRFSQSLEENFVMLDICEVKKIVFIICKYLVSILKAEPWYPDRIKNRYKYFKSKFFKLPAPQGFLLKSSFFKELERVPEDGYWQEEYYLDRVQSIFLHMCSESEYKTNQLESLLPGTDISSDMDAFDSDKGDILFASRGLDSGKVSSYFASTTQRQSAGYIAPTIYRELKKMDIYDFVKRKI